MKLRKSGKVRIFDFFVLIMVEIIWVIHLVILLSIFNIVSQSPWQLSYKESCFFALSIVFISVKKMTFEN